MIDAPPDQTDLTKGRPPSQSFRLFDAMVLIAATAVGLTFVRYSQMRYFSWEKPLAPDRLIYFTLIQIGKPVGGTLPILYGICVAVVAKGLWGARPRREDFTSRVQAIRESLHQVIVGQDATIDSLLICGLTGTHALLVGVPGLAKTLMVKALASAFRWKFSRIQFTPDLMPSDITGYELLGREGLDDSPKMVFRPGPVFANLVLADEINRAAPKINLTARAVLSSSKAPERGAGLSCRPVIATRATPTAASGTV